jgi:hypothetical protein
VTEMIERAALKVRVTMLDRFGYEMGKEESIVLVRAVLEAMREPTAEMLEDGGTNFAGEDRMDVAVSWPIMIDTALGVRE